MDGWHKVKAGAFWTTDTEGRVQAIEEYTDTATADTFADLVWTRVFARAANLVPELVCVADGAHWRWRMVERHFPQATPIVDWFHASAYLVKIANAAYGENAPQAKTGLEPVKTAWYDGKWDTLIRAAAGC